MKRILISGFLGFGNFGDEALLYVLIHDLVNLGIRRGNVTVISNNPNLTADTYNVNSINRWNLIQLIFNMANHDAIIFVGGLFQDKTSIRSFLYYFLQLLIAGLFGKEIVFVGAGIGPFQRKITNTLFKIGMKPVKMLTVRDQASLYATSHEQRTLVTCDPVWSINTDFSFQNEIPKVNWKLPILGVSMRNNKNLKGHHLINLADKISRILNGMKDWQILFIPCMTSEDLPVLYELMDLVSRKITDQNRIVMLENFSQFSIPNQVGILGSCDVVIAMRYHALLAALVNEKPVFGLIYDQKVKSLLDFSGQVGVSPRDDLEQSWSYFWQNLKYSSGKAKEAKQKAVQLHKINIELLEKLLIG